MLFYVLSTLACILSCLALILAIVALVKIVAMEKSTHTFQYMPTPSEEDKEEPWATRDREVEKINKEFSQNYDMEDEIDVTII